MPQGDLKLGEIDCRINIQKIAIYLNHAKYEARRGNFNITVHYLDKLTAEFDRARILTELEKYQKPQKRRGTMFDIFKTFQKGIIAFFIVLLAVALEAVGKALTGFSPVVCTADVTTNCTPQIIATAYAAVVPAIAGFIFGAVNWLKNKAK